MRKEWIICIMALWGAESWGDPVAIPATPSPIPPTHKDAHAQGAPDPGKGSAPRAPRTAFRTPAEPQAKNALDPATEEGSGSDDQAGEDGQPSEPETSGIVLDFRTRELMELKKIARELGGNLVISIEPRGLSPADLIIPLKRSGLFEVSAKDGKTFLVTSSGEGQKRELEREIAALARRQAALLHNIEVLESMRADGRVSDSNDESRQRNKPTIAEQESPLIVPPDPIRSEHPLPTR